MRGLGRVGDQDDLPLFALSRPERDSEPDAKLPPMPLGAHVVEDYRRLSLSLKARAERRSKKPRIRFVPSKVLMSTNLGRGLASSLKDMGKKVLPAIGQRVVVAEAVAHGLTVSEYAPQSPAHEEFRALAKAVEKILDR